MLSAEPLSVSVETALEDIWHCTCYIMMKPLPADRSSAEDHVQMLCQDISGRTALPHSAFGGLEMFCHTHHFQQGLGQAWELWSTMSLSPPSTSVLVGS